jgi:hypothetical protein
MNRFESWIVEAARKNTNIRYDLIETVGQESRYSSLLPHHIPKVTSAFIREIPSANSILDATAHIGVDSLNFINMYPNCQLTAIEIDQKTASVLGRNLNNIDAILGKRVPNRPVVIVGSSISYLESYIGPQFDFVYFDPPWGGPNYKNIPKLELQLDNNPISYIIQWVFNKGITRKIVVKLPMNANIENIQFQLSGLRHEIKLYSIQNYYLMFIHLL